jgi:hypothetical protein
VPPVGDFHKRAHAVTQNPPRRGARQISHQSRQRWLQGCATGSSRPLSSCPEARQARRIGSTGAASTRVVDSPDGRERRFSCAQGRPRRLHEAIVAGYRRPSAEELGMCPSRSFG